MTMSNQNRGRSVLALATMLGAGVVFGSIAVGARTPVAFNPFEPVRVEVPVDTTLDAMPGPIQPITPAQPPVPPRPPIRDPFRPPTRSPFTP